MRPYLPFGLIVSALVAAPLAQAQTTAPSLYYAGPTVAFPNDPITGSIVSNLPSELARYATLQWTLRDARTKAQLADGMGSPTGGVVPFYYTPTAAASLLLTMTLRVQTPDAAPTQYVKSVPISVVAPFKPQFRIAGMTRIAAGQQHVFKAKVISRAPLSAYASRITGVWTIQGRTLAVPADPMSDGTVVLTIPAAELAAGSSLGAPETIQYRAQWVDRPETASVASFSTQTWAYSFPSVWQLNLQQTGTKAPAAVNIRAVPANTAALPYLDEVIYTWRIGDQAPITTTTPNLSKTLFEGAENTEVSVHIMDRFGNQARAVAQVNLLPPDPITASLSVLPVSKWIHAPLKTAVMTRFAGVNSRDPIASVSYALNGAPVATGLPGRPAYLDITTPGAHTIAATGRTRSGREAKTEISYLVREPDQPRCAHTATGPSSTGVYTYQINATSETGPIVKYEWFQGTVKLPSALSRIAVRPTDQPISYRATNSGGNTCSGNV